MPLMLFFYLNFHIFATHVGMNINLIFFKLKNVNSVSNAFFVKQLKHIFSSQSSSIMQVEMICFALKIADIFD